jgi:hypothetical protein
LLAGICDGGALVGTVILFISALDGQGWSGFVISLIGTLLLGAIVLSIAQRARKQANAAA